MEPDSRRLDGLACIECGADLALPGTRSVPDGFGPNGQLFRCAPGTGCATLTEPLPQ